MRQIQDYKPNEYDCVYYLSDGYERSQKFRMHVFGVQSYTRNFDRRSSNCVITIDKLVGENEPLSICEWVTSFSVGNKLNYMMEKLDGEDDHMIFEYNGIDDLIDIIDSLLLVCQTACNIQTHCCDDNSISKTNLENS